jgi:hypothetical protein
MAALTPADLRRLFALLNEERYAARRERDRAADARRAGQQAQQTGAEKRSELQQWRDDARRAREAAKEKTTQRGPTRDRAKDRGGPDYER